MLDEKKSLKNENSLLKMNLYKFESEKQDLERQLVDN